MKILLVWVKLAELYISLINNAPILFKEYAGFLFQMPLTGSPDWLSPHQPFGGMNDA
jgi:hypothetical protein